jgi:hypothetical protein
MRDAAPIPRSSCAGFLASRRAPAAGSLPGLGKHAPRRPRTRSTAGNGHSSSGFGAAREKDHHLRSELEHAEQIADRRAIDRNIGVPGGRNRIGEIVPASPGDRRQAPVPLDEFHDGRMVGVIMDHTAAA